MTGYGRTLVFSAVFVVTYTLCFYFNVALFKYYPLIGEFHVDAMGPKAGPPISWYGWIAVAVPVSLAAALIIPRSVSNRIPPAVTWIVPALVVLAVLVYEKRWFI